MLADQPRTTKYHSVILQNKESLKDKVILDVGCGTGIISLFCAHHARPKAVSASALICAHQLWAWVAADWTGGHHVVCFLLSGGKQVTGPSTAEMMTHHLGHEQLKGNKTTSGTEILSEGHLGGVILAHCSFRWGHTTVLGCIQLTCPLAFFSSLLSVLR